ncbi:putative rhamnosyl transferase [Akkermansiaceae bacterium]|nr:putative rhamnosyl transferase [Akkermansiaceae bacterium]
MDYKHYIITIFNYPNDYPHLKERFNIFNNFTKPSIEAQSNKNFTWIILANPNHISLFNEFKGVDAHIVKGEIHNQRLPSVSSIAKAIYPFINSKPLPQYIISTRICNDDAIHEDFIKLTQEKFLNNISSRLLDYKGYRYLVNTKTLYTQEKYHSKFPSPFCSLVYKNDYQPLTIDVKRPAPPQVVIEYPHTDLHKFHPLVLINEERMWCQLIHDHNLLMKGEGTSKVSLDNLKFFNISK